MTTMIACDGSCIQDGSFRKGDDAARPGAAGFAARLEDGTVVGRTEAHANGTIGAMEVRALLMGLRFASDLVEAGHDGPIEIVCDSQYAVNGYNDWLDGWAAKGYHKKGGLANADDWREIDQYRHEPCLSEVKVGWIRAHTGGRDPRSLLNAECDARVNATARTQIPSDDSHKAFPDSPTARKAARTPAATAIEETGDRPAKGVLAQAADLLSKEEGVAAVIAQGLERALADASFRSRHSTQALVDAHDVLRELRGAGR